VQDGGLCSAASAGGAFANKTGWVHHGALVAAAAATMVAGSRGGCRDVMLLASLATAVRVQTQDALYTEGCERSSLHRPGFRQLARLDNLVRLQRVFSVTVVIHGTRKLALPTYRANCSSIKSVRSNK